VGFGRQGAAGARKVRHTLVLKMYQQLGEPALDRLEVVEPGVGGVELLDQLGDTILEMADSRLVAAGELNPLDLVDQSLDDGLDLVRRSLVALVARLERVSERCNAAFERREYAACAAGGGLIDLSGQRGRLVGQLRQRLVR